MAKLFGVNRPAIVKHISNIIKDNELVNYDHQCVTKPSGNKAEYTLKYDECREFINYMRFTNDSKVFGVEKTKGQLDGILACINQMAFGEEIINH